MIKKYKTGDLVFNSNITIAPIPVQKLTQFKIAFVSAIEKYNKENVNDTISYNINTKSISLLYTKWEYDIEKSIKNYFLNNLQNLFEISDIEYAGENEIVLFKKSKDSVYDVYLHIDSQTDLLKLTFITSGSALKSLLLDMFPDDSDDFIDNYNILDSLKIMYTNNELVFSSEDINMGKNKTVSKENTDQNENNEEALEDGDAISQHVVTFDELSKYNGTGKTDDSNVGISKEELFSYDELIRKNRMAMMSPAHTTIGSAINFDKLEKELTKYITSTNNRMLGYEFISGPDRDDKETNNRLVIITGCDDDEKALPIFDHPVIAHDLKKNVYVCVDVRKYIKTITDQPTDILPLAKDTGAVTFIILRGLITLDYIFGVQHYIGNNKTIAAAYGMFIAALINTIIPLNPVESMNVEIVAAYFGTIMFYKDSEIEDSYSNIIGRLSTTDFPAKITASYVEEILGKIDIYGRNLEALVTNIKAVLNSGKESLVDRASLLAKLSSLWYGPGENMAMGIGLENGPTWVALMYGSLVDKNFKKSRLGGMLDKFSRYIKPLEFDKFINQYIEQHKHEEL